MAILYFLKKFVDFFLNFKNSYYICIRNNFEERLFRTPEQPAALTADVSKPNTL